MTRVATVIASSLAFAILGLVIGHLCIANYRPVEIMGSGIQVSGGRELKTEILLACYLVPPVVGAFIGFSVSIAALLLFRRQLDQGANRS